MVSRGQTFDFQVFSGPCVDLNSGSVQYIVYPGPGEQQKAFRLSIYGQAWVTSYLTRLEK